MKPCVLCGKVNDGMPAAFDCMFYDLEFSFCLRF